MDFRQPWSHDRPSSFSPPSPAHYPGGDKRKNRDSGSSYDQPPPRIVTTSSSASRRLGSEDSPCGTDCSSEGEILRPDESDPFAGKSH